MVSSTARVGSINVLLTADIRNGVGGISAFASAVENGGKRASAAVAGIDRSVGSMSKTLGAINTRGITGLTVGALRARTSVEQLRGVALAASAAFGGLIPATIGASMIQYADRAHLMANSLKTVTKDSTELAAVQQALFDVAQRSRSGLESTTTLYARTARATDSLGLSQEKLLRITETVQKAFAIGGASPQEAQGAAIQLSQGLASDRLGGEEFRSVAENAPVLLKAIAQNMGVNIGQLRKMSMEGQLTAKTVTQAIIAASEKIDEEFSKTTSTIGQAMVLLDNQILKFVESSKGVGTAASTIVSGLNALGNNIEGVATLILLLAGRWALAFGGRQIGAITRSVTAMQSMRTEALAAAKAQEAQAMAEMKTARSDMVQKRLAVNAAYRSTEMTLKQVEKAEREAGIATQAYQAASARAADATNKHSIALRAASRAGTAFAVAGRAASAAWSFVGGPFGAALMAISAGFYLYNQNAANAQAITDRYADAIQAAKDKTTGADQTIRQTAEAMARAAEKMGAAEKNMRLAQAAADFETNASKMERTAQSMALSLSLSGSAARKTADEILALVEQFKNGEISAENLRAGLDNLAQANPDLSSGIASIQALGDQADAARGQADGLTFSAHNLANALGLIASISAGFKNGGIGSKGARPESLYKTYEDSFNLAKRMGIPGLNDDAAIEKRKNAKPSGGGRRRKSDAEKTAEKFSETIAELQNKALMFTLDPIDQEVAQTAQQIGIADSKIKAFIASAKGQGEPPAEIVQIKEQLQQIANLEFQKKLDELKQSSATKFLSEINQKTIETARSFGVAESKITQFIAAAKSGQMGSIPADIKAIRDQIEQTFYDERLLSFADQFSSAFGNFFSEAVSDFDNIEQAALNFGNALADAAFQLFVIEPLVKSIKDAMSGGMMGGSSGGGIGGFFSSILGGLFGGGGSAFPSAPGAGWLADGGGAIVGGKMKGFGPKTRSLGGGMIADSGFGPRNFLSVLEEGESVLTNKQMGRTLDLMTGATAAMKDGGPRGATKVEVTVVGARGNAEIQEMVASGVRQGISAYDKQMPDRVEQIKRNPRKR